MLSTDSSSLMRSDQQRQVREDTRGRLQAPARSTQTPISTLRRSHFPDPPTPALPAQQTPDQTVLRPVPDAPKKRRPKPSSSAVCLTMTRTGAPSTVGNNASVDIERAISDVLTDAGQVDETCSERRIPMRTMS